MKLINNPNVFIPEEIKSEFNTYHTFVVQVKKRTELIKYLKKMVFLLQFIIQYQFIYKKLLQIKIFKN